MNVEIKFLLRKSTGDQPLAAEQDVRDLLQTEQCRPADFLFDFTAGIWTRVGDHPALSDLFAKKPTIAMERRLIYVMALGATPVPLGPFSTKEIQLRAQGGELCDSTWVFVDGDKEWRQVCAVKVLRDMLPSLPTDVPIPTPVAEANVEVAVADTLSPEAAQDSILAGLLNGSSEKVESQTNPSIQLDLGSEEAQHVLGGRAAGASAGSAAPVPPAMSLNLGVGSPEKPPQSEGPPPVFRPGVPLVAAASGVESAPGGNTPVPILSTDSAPAFLSGEGHEIEREEQTLALDTLGLSLSSEPPAPLPIAKPVAPLPSPPAMTQSKAPPRAPVVPVPPPVTGAKDLESFDGIVAEVPTGPIWLVKPANSETVSGPFRFLDIIKYLEEGKLTKNDKISRVGSKSFVKILQQYEFNVKFSIETVVERGVEKQKILIRRRHPRVPYITGVQIVSKHGMQAGHCVNISAGGILMEVPKAEFNLGEVIEVKILPGLIAKPISCAALVIGKIPKIPPGYALKFEGLKNEDKEAIEFYVQETLKRELSKKQ